MDRDTSGLAQKTFAIFDKETRQHLGNFQYWYGAFKQSLDRTGFDVDAIYTNLPVDVECDYKHRYMEDIKNPYEYDEFSNAE
jgi:hypothetical protein